MLFFKIDKSLWSSVKTFVVFLNKLPEYPHTYIHDIDIDEVCLKELRVSLMEKDKIDRFIDAFKSAMYQEFSVNEEGMVTNQPGQQGGFSAITCQRTYCWV